MDRTYLLEALKEGEKRLGFTHPNPAVGAVLVKDSKVLRVGHHEGAGHPHAEARALEGLSKADCQNATLYVTLEPCCQFEGKRTPACADLLIERGISKLVYAFQDPNPAVVGKGIEKLISNGVQVTYFPLPEIEDFYRSYTYWTKTKRPYTIGKLALSLDGKIAGEGGLPIHLTSDRANETTHLHRKKANAILSTARTILNDNPQLNARCEETVRKELFVLDSDLRLIPELKIFSSTGPVTLFCGESAPDSNQARLERLGAKIIRMPVEAMGGLNLNEVFARIGALGIHELWVEAGGKLFSSLVTRQLFNEAYLYLTPHWLGDEAYPAFHGVNPISGASSVKWSELGPDAVCQIQW